MAGCYASQFWRTTCHVPSDPDWGSVDVKRNLDLGILPIAACTVPRPRFNEFRYGGTAVSAQTVSLGVIVTELVINALKHAFPEDREDGRVVVSYETDASDWKLVVSDNWIGSRKGLHRRRAA
jgi:two-component sensor histidine kinase